MIQEAQESKAYLLDDARLDHYWGEIAPLLEKVPLFRDLYDPQDVYTMAKMGHFQIWALSDGAIRTIMVTQIQSFPKAKVLMILAVVGKKFFELWDSADATLEWVARDSGCSFIHAVGRPGFARKRGSGEIEGVLISKKISQMRTQ